MARQSDRWITPRVIVFGLFCATLIVLGAIGAVTYLSSIGKDPDPMLKLAAQVATAVGSLGTLVLTLTNRTTTAKVERNTGLQARELMNLNDRLDDPGRHAYPETSYPTGRNLPPVPDSGTAPAANGRLGA